MEIPPQLFLGMKHENLAAELESSINYCFFQNLLHQDKNEHTIKGTRLSLFTPKLLQKSYPSICLNFKELPSLNKMEQLQ